MSDVNADPGPLISSKFIWGLISTLIFVSKSPGVLLQIQMAYPGIQTMVVIAENHPNKWAGHG